MLGAQKKKLVGWILTLNKIYLMKRMMMVKRIPVRYKMAPTRVRTPAASLTVLGFLTHKSQVQTRNIRHLQAVFKYQ